MTKVFSIAHLSMKREFRQFNLFRKTGFLIFDGYEFHFGREKILICKGSGSPSLYDFSKNESQEIVLPHASPNCMFTATVNEDFAFFGSSKGELFIADIENFHVNQKLLFEGILTGT